MIESATCADREPSPLEEAVHNTSAELAEVEEAVDCLISRLSRLARVVPEPGAEVANASPPSTSSRTVQGIEGLRDRLSIMKIRLRDMMNKGDF